MKEIKNEWAQTVEFIMSHKVFLTRWLYENQGDMRFGAENRIFLVLVDKENPNEAWKLKRNIDLIKPAITEWIETFDRSAVESLLISFEYKNKSYETYSDAIFVCKDIM